jgi:hypothetical protein
MASANTITSFPAPARFTERFSDDNRFRALLPPEE